MKFKVRDGFFLQYSESQDNGQGGTMAVPRFFPGSQVVDLSPEIAADNLHMLEPQDSEAKALHDSKIVPANSGMQAPMPVDASMIASIVAATLQAMGVSPKKAA